MDIIISNTSGEPLYRQIAEQLKAAILSGELRAGDMLPSVRGLARELKISVITTTRAYQELGQEGWVSGVQGKGCYVLPQNTELVRETALKETEQLMREAVRRARAAGISAEEIFQIFQLMTEEE